MSWIKNVLLGLAALLVLVAVGLAFAGIEGLSLGVWLALATAICAVAAARSPRLGTLLAASVAFGANAYLFARKLSATTAPSLCNISDTINCDIVNQSAYSELFGLPVTLLGMGFFAGIALASLAGPASAPRFHQVNALLALIAVLVSVYLAAASWTIGAVCLVCITIYVCSFILLLAGLLGMRTEDRTLLADLSGLVTSRSFVTVAGVFLVVLLIGGAKWRASQGTTPARPIAELDETERGAAASEIGTLYAAPPGELVLDGTEPVLGDPSAPYLVVEFADYGCPHCAHAQPVLKQLVKERPDVQVRFKQFPLSGACNPGIQGNQGAERCVAAIASECAHRQGRFWEMAHALFQNPGYFAPEDVRFHAEKLNLDVDAFEACLQDPDAAQSVIDDATAGVRAGVQGTPAFFLKGTHGDEFVLITWGTDALVRVIEAHEAGLSLPPPRPAPPM